MTRLLETTSYGEQSGVPLLIVHGLFGSGRNWRALAKHFARRRWVLAVDLRNHGNSFRDASNTYPDLAADLAAVIAAHGGVADVLGHSMGGKAAMMLALQYPEMVRRLLVARILRRWPMVIRRLTISTLCNRCRSTGLPAAQRPIPC